MKYEFQLNLTELAKEWFEIEGVELDVLSMTVVSEAIGFALEALRTYQTLQREAIEKATAEAEEGVEPLDARRLIEMVKLSRMVDPGDNIARDLHAALRYVLTHGPDVADWRLVMQELKELATD